MIQPLLTEHSYSWVLDASVLLAMLRSEPGGMFVQEVLVDSAISSVNWSEVVQKAIQLELDSFELTQDFENVGLDIIPFTSEQAETAALLWPITRIVGLSLADRACLGLAQTLQLPALTCDRTWAELGIAIEVRLIR